jgi:hypothetical protein
MIASLSNLSNSRKRIVSDAQFYFPPQEFFSIGFLCFSSTNKKIGYQIKSRLSTFYCCPASTNHLYLVIHTHTITHIPIHTHTHAQTDTQKHTHKSPFFPSFFLFHFLYIMLFYILSLSTSLSSVSVSPFLPFYNIPLSIHQFVVLNLSIHLLISRSTFAAS